MECSEEFFEPRLVPGEPTGLEVVDHAAEPRQLCSENRAAVFLLEKEQAGQVGICLELPLGVGECCG